MARMTSSAYDGSAARDIRTQRKLEIKKEKKAANNLVKLTNKQIRKARRQSLKPFAITSTVLCVAVFFALAAFTVFGQVELTELAGQINSANNKISQLEGEQVQLEMQVANLIDPTTVEQYAKTYMGMSTVNTNNVTYVNIAGANEGVVYSVDHQNFMEKILNFFGF